jgi:hypothetical protein
LRSAELVSVSKATYKVLFLALASKNGDLKITLGAAAEQNKIQRLFTFRKKLDFVLWGD